MSALCRQARLQHRSTRSSVLLSTQEGPRGVAHHEDEVRREYQEKLGEELGALFYELHDRLHALARFQECRALSATRATPSS